MMKQDPEEQIPEYDEIFRLVCLQTQNRGQFKDQLPCTDVDSCSEMTMSHQVMKRKMNGGARGGGWTRKV